MIAQAMAISDTDDAVSALKVAGQFGVSQVGPAVDRQTHNRSKALTTAASHDNGMLQAITTSMAGWMWATTILFPGALLLQIPTALATSAATSASSNDKMKASGLVHGMYEKYASALDQFGGTAGPAVAGYAPLFATGLSPATCWDAGTNPQWCAAVTTALMNERNPARLRALAAHVAHAGFPMAANSLLTKADRIAYDPGY